MRSSRHTLSNALDISRVTPRTSYPTSKDLCISWVTDRSWIIHESPDLTRGWFRVIRSFLLKNYSVPNAEMFYCRSDALRLRIFKRLFIALFMDWENI